MWSINRDASDVDGLRENQRHDFDAHLQRFGGEERRRTELGIVTDREILGGERTAEEREAQVSDLYFASQGGGSFFFNGGAELIDGDQKWNDENQDNQNTNDDENRAESFIDGGLLFGRIHPSRKSPGVKGKRRLGAARE